MVRIKWFYKSWEKYFFVAFSKYISMLSCQTSQWILILENGISYKIIVIDTQMENYTAGDITLRNLLC